MAQKQGLQIFDATGTIVLDITDRLTRILGEFETGTTNGFLTDTSLIEGTPWFLTASSLPSLGWSNPISITFSGTTISWEFGTGGTENLNRKILYGVY